MIRYYLKKYLNKFFKGMHNFFLLFGINISFVRKNKGKSAIEHNSLKDANEAYSSKEYQAEVLSSEHQLFFRQLLDFIKNKKIDLSGKTIADFGCGVGNIIWHIRQQFKTEELYGFDFSDKAIDVAKKRVPDASFSTHDIYTVLDKKFDFLFCTEVLEHLLYPDKALKNMIQMTNKGGCLAITIPDGRNDTYEGHINFWSPESWKVFIETIALNNKSETGYLNDNMMYALIFVL